MENLSRNGDSSSQDANDDGEDAAAGGVKKPAKVGSKSASSRLGLINTIERNVSNINNAATESDTLTDPMFQKMSKAFDEGGAKGMLMTNLVRDI